MTSLPFSMDDIDLRVRRTLRMTQAAPGGGHLQIALAPGQRLSEDIEGTLDAILGGDWQDANWSYEPVALLPAGTPERAQDFLEDLERQLAAAGIVGADVVSSTPTGWVYISSVMTHFLVRWQRQRPDTQYLLEIIHFRHGTARFEISSTDPRVTDLKRWCEAQAQSRDIETGQLFAE